MRWTGVMLSGAFASLAGVWRAADQHQLTDNMSNGRGYIALAAMIPYLLTIITLVGSMGRAKPPAAGRHFTP